MQRLLLLVLALALVSSCARPVVAGSGTRSTDDRGFSGYTHVEAVGAGLKLVVRTGDTELVRISGDDNLVPLVETSLAGGTLTISTGKRVLRPKVPLVAEVTARRLESVRLSGAVDAEVQGFADDRLEAELTGVGELRLSGTADELRVTISGAGRLDGLGLVAKDAEVSILGAGQADVHATRRLVAKITGAGEIHYAGHPRVEPTILGGGFLRPVEEKPK